MRRFALSIIGCVVLAACGGGSSGSTSGGSGSSTGATTGSTTSQGTSTSGSTSAGTTTGGSGTTTGATGTTTGTGTSGTTGSATAGITSGSTTGGTTASTTGGLPFVPCSTGLTYVQGNCVLTSCATAPSVPSRFPALCGLPDSGIGFCFAGVCEAVDLSADSSNCGGMGHLCPADTTCVAGLCATDAGAASACDAGACPLGRLCTQPACVFDDTCNGALDMEPCLGSTFEGECCEGACVTLFGNPDHCGSCGNVCPMGSLCEGNACVPTTCGATATVATPCVLSDGGAAGCCRGACADLSADPSNCGICGGACLDGGRCVNGSCSSYCRTNTDCGSGDACVSGQCYATACGSGAGETLCAVVVSPGSTTFGLCCAGSCVPTASDSRNCGGCGVDCGSGSCVQGECTGLAPPTDCTVLANGELCVSGANAGVCCGGACTFDDDSNCGSCGQICPQGSSCDHGGCLGVLQPDGGGSTGRCGAASECATGQTCAVFRGGLCVTQTCSAADEGLACGFSDGGTGTCCEGVCAAIDGDPANCGGCGLACPAGEICANDACTVAMSQTSCANATCPAGTHCLGGSACVPASCAGRGDGDPCAFGIAVASVSRLEGICCGGSCVDTLRDPGNCGGCGLTCSDGVCLHLFAEDPPPCVPNQSSGACAQSCGPGTFCLGNQCQPLSCSAAGFLCPAEDGNPGVCCPGGAGLTCADELSDPNNCGDCGIECPNGQTCSHGVCSGTPAPCNTVGAIGAFCDLDAGYGWVCCPGMGCTDVDTDPHDCGACGLGCAQGLSCTQGICR